jgi:hypothetical protein
MRVHRNCCGLDVHKQTIAACLISSCATRSLLESARCDGADIGKLWFRRFGTEVWFGSISSFFSTSSDLRIESPSSLHSDADFWTTSLRARLADSRPAAAWTHQFSSFPRLNRRARI